MKVRNASYWEEIEELEPWQNKGPQYDKIWHHTEALQKEGHLTAIDLIHLKPLLEAVYQAGKSL